MRLGHLISNNSGSTASVAATIIAIAVAALPLTISFGCALMRAP